MKKNFKEKYLAGEIEFEEIDDYSYEWGIGDDERTLAKYLGLNEEEEDAWVSVSEEALKVIFSSPILICVPAKAGGWELERSHRNGVKNGR